MPDLYDQKLADHGFALGDLVLYTSVRDSTGGVLFQIINDTSPVKPHTTKRTVVKKRSEWKPNPGIGAQLWGGRGSNDGKYVEVEYEAAEHGAWDESGKKIMVAATRGFVRIKPIFDFFATNKGKSPRGKGETLIIEYRDIKHSLVRVDLVLLGSKYVELGNIIRDVARKEGMCEAAAEPTDDHDPDPTAA